MSSYLHEEIFTVDSPKDQCVCFKQFIFYIFINDYTVSIVTSHPLTNLFFQFMVDTESLYR